MKRLRPFFSFYGSKWRIINEYPPPIWTNQIIEPFSGSASYSLRYFYKNINLNDVDENIFHLWKYLIHAKEKDILSLPDLKDGQSTDDLNVCQEAKILIGFWLGKGAAFPGKTKTAWNNKENTNRSGCNFWGPGIRRRISSQQKYIRHWKITNFSFLDVPKKKGTWFVDPPYQGKPGSYYRCNNKDIDFSQLGEWAKSLEKQVIVCENRGANWLNFEKLKTVRSNCSHGKKYSKEVFYHKIKEMI